MREILFRGKRLDNNEWVYGLLTAVKVKGLTAHLITTTQEATVGNENVPPMGICFQLNEDIFMVDSSTVGQYTGHTDKNGNKIFENDIVCIPKDPAALVIWRKCGWRLHFKGSKEYDDGSCESVSFEARWFSLGMAEVTGNIHDTPELMKGDKE